MLSGHKEVAPCSNSRTVRCICHLGSYSFLHAKGCTGASTAAPSHSSLIRTVAEDLAAAQPPLSLPHR